MLPLLSDSQFNSLALIIIAGLGLVGTLFSAYWARGAKDQAKEAKKNSQQALHEVSTNGGMSDPNPNLNDHVKYQTEMTEWLVRNQQSMWTKFEQHLKHSQMMDQALAEVYMEVRPEPKQWPAEEPPPSPPI